MQKHVVSPMPALLRWSALAALALTICMSHATCDFHTDVGARTSELAQAALPDYDIQGTGRRPLVVVGGVTEQLPTADYISTVGGLTTNATPASGAGDLEATTETVSSNAAFGGQLAYSASISPTAFNGTQVDNYNPTGLSTTYVIDQVVTSATVITGLTAQPAGTTIVFRNSHTSGGALTFKNLSTSTAANQFQLAGGTDWILPIGTSMVLRYSSSSVWRMVNITTDLPTLTVDGATTLKGATSLGNITYTTQTNTSTGTVNDQTLNATTTIFQWGSGVVANSTFTGFTGGATGRVLIVECASTANQITLSNLTGSSAGNQLLNLGNTTAVLKGLGSSATYVYDGSQWRMTSISSTQYDALITFNNSSTVFKGATFQLGTQGTTVAASTGFQASASSSHYVAKISSGESVTCGSNPVVLATDNAGTITIGTTSGGNCTVTFGVAYTTNAPGCVVRFRDQTTNNAFVYTTSTTALTITGASDGKTFDYFCWGSA